MLLERMAVIENHLRAFIRERYSIELGNLMVEAPPRTELGDLAFTFPFELAKMVKRAPRQIAQEVVNQIEPVEGVERLEAAGAGYVNVFFERTAFFRDLLQWLQTPPPGTSGGKIIVEHTNINPNKAAHIGHLRNAALGDSFVKLLRASGRQVEVQNYIDNTGVQVADVVVGFQHLRGLTLADVEAIRGRFDFYCWDLYAEVSEWYGGDESRLQLRRRTLHDIETGGNPSSQLAEHISNRIVKAHLETMFRLNVRYHVLPRESEILHLEFWREAFEQLKRRKSIYLAEAGPHSGCWVMHLPGEDGQQDEEKIIVRSNGTVTYVGKDIAYQLWKFGLLGKTFHYRPFFHYPDGGTVWVSASQAGDFNSEPDFGRAERVYNVIDARQAYLQRVVVQGLRSLGFQEEASHSVHFSYEMVALSPRCCADLGIELSNEDRSRPYVEVSGRRGLGVKADELIDKLEEKARLEVDARQPDLEGEKRQEIARQIAVGALRYFLLKYTRNSVIAFDFAEALGFEGETGPYLQYSVVRANNIFRRLREVLPDWNEESWRNQQLSRASGLLAGMLGDNEFWNLILQVARIEEVVRQSIQTLEVACLAKHAFTLAQLFNLFYHKVHILSEADADKRDFYLSVADTARLGLIRSLDLLGIEVPDKM